LKAILSRLGLAITPGCKCNQRATEMDRRGPAWCDDNLETIIGWLREEYRDRRAKHAVAVVAHKADSSKPAPEALPVWLKLPFIDAAARQMVKRAIRAAEKQTAI
jgi:hypothetical protein